MIKIPKQIQEAFKFHALTIKEVKLLPTGKKDNSCLNGITWKTTNYSAQQIEDNFNHYNTYVVVIQPRTMIIDIENHAKNKEKIFATLDTLNTFTAKTWSGGRHYYVKLDKEYPEMGANQYLKGKEKEHFGELKCFGSIVYGVGTKIDGKEYKTINETELKTITIKQIALLLKPFMQKELKNQKGERAVKTGYWKILKTEEATEQERVSCVMQIVATHTTFNKQEVLDYIAKHNDWTNFDADKSKEKIFATYDKYAKKPNPIKHEEPNKKSVASNQVLDLKDYNYFLKLKKDKRYLIEDFIYPQTTVMFYSPPGQFKSLLALQAAMCVATGKPYLGFKTKKMPVLYCDKENNEQILKQRLIGLHKGLKLRRNNFPLNLLVRNGDLNNAKFVESLKETIKEKEIKLVIFDTLHRFGDYEENKADDINRLYTTVFQPITAECDCTVMFLHHTNKDGGYRGSGDFLGMVDTSYSIRRKGKTEYFSLINEKSRSGEIETLSGEILFEEGYIKINRISKELEKEARKAKVSKLKEVTNIIQSLFTIKGQERKRSEIMDYFELNDKCNYSKATIKRSLDWLVLNDYLSSDKKGKYVRLWEGDGSL